MATTLDRIRLAVTTFDDPGQLWTMAGELIARGIGAKQLCIVATAPAMALLRRLRPPRLGGASSSENGLDSELADLCDDVELCCQLRTGEGVMASSGPVMDLLLGGLPSGGAASKVIIDENSLDPEGALRQGSPTLVVLSKEASQQRTATQTLLRYSQHRVKTFEIAVPPELETHRV